MSLNTERWQEFKIGDLFSYERGKESAPNQNINGDTWIISEVSTNNGYVRKVKPTKVFDGHCITVSVNFAQTVYYQPKEFCASVNIMILRPLSEKIRQRQLLFIASVLSKLHKKFSYTDKISKDILLNEKISLPAKLYNNSPKYHPDWEFMEEYIKYIENKHIDKVDNLHREEIDKALKVAGLTEKDLDGDLNVEPAGMYCEFKIGDLFSISPTKNYGLTNDELYIVNGKNKVVANTGQSNGIGGYTNFENTEKGNMITFSDTTDHNSIFYQPTDFVGYSHVQGLYPLSFKEKWNKEAYLFFLTVFRKKASGKGFSYANKFNRKIASEMKIKLPAINEKTPDFEYMEKAIYIYISKTIKSWKLANEKEIRALRKVINR